MGLVGLSRLDPAKLLPQVTVWTLDFFLGAAGEALEGRMDFTLVLSVWLSR